MANRSTRIRQRIQSLLGDELGQKFTKEMVYRQLDSVQRKICEEGAYETAGTINITAGTELYNYPDGFIREFSACMGTFATVTDSNIIQRGYVSSKKEALVNTTNTTLTWDTPFVKTYKDLSGTLVPAYYFGVKSAYVSDPTSQESIVIVSQSLTGVVLRSTSDSTIVKFEAFE
jgi:hypothetical protein